jgi:hypothetical protein
MSHDPELIKEAEAKMEEYALAKRTVNQLDEWFKSHQNQLPQISAHGMWFGRRQQFKEVYKQQVFIDAVMMVIEEYELPIRDILMLLSNGQMKDITYFDVHGEYVRSAVKASDEQDGGIEKKHGKVGTSPIKKAPSENNYVILEPGEEPKQ